MSAIFKFKQFTIAQDQCAMKVGTDGVLLGAWTTLNNNPKSILDIGTGTGVIALQMAQRSIAENIDAVEIDEKAFEQCSENFEASPWADRLFCYHASIQEFASEIDEKYDLIVSNPPFYTENYKSKNSSRDLARFEDALPFHHLFVCVAHLLSENGIFAVIVPKKEEKTIIDLALKNKLYTNRICCVKGNPVSEIKRVLLEFSFHQKAIIEEQLIIENKRHQYSDGYKNLVAKFYLKM